MTSGAIAVPWAVPGGPGTSRVAGRDRLLLIVELFNMLRAVSERGKTGNTPPSNTWSKRPPSNPRHNHLSLLC